MSNVEKQEKRRRGLERTGGRRRKIRGGEENVPGFCRGLAGRLLGRTIEKGIKIWITKRMIIFEICIGYSNA
jgi:hypothetical protein